MYSILAPPLGYKAKDDVEYTKLYELSGMFVKHEDTQETIEGVPAFPFRLHLRQSAIIFYAQTQESRTAWVQTLREAIGYSNLFAFYSIHVPPFYRSCRESLAEAPSPKSVSPNTA